MIHHYGANLKISFQKTTEPIGPDFIPNGKTVQEGVNPNSLIPAKDLNMLDDKRMQDAVEHAGDKSIIVIIWVM